MTTLSVPQFILIFGELEAIELSNLDNPNATEPNLPRIELAIADATSWLDSYLAAAGCVDTNAHANLVIANRHRVIATVARYYLDTLRTRENVVSDYERVLKEIDQQIENWKQRLSVGTIRFTQQPADIRDQRQHHPYWY